MNENINFHPIVIKICNESYPVFIHRVQELAMRRRQFLHDV